jgi:hypothetical protein
MKYWGLFQIFYMKKFFGREKIFSKNDPYGGNFMRESNARIPNASLTLIQGKLGF